MLVSGRVTSIQSRTPRCQDCTRRAAGSFAGFLNVGTLGGTELPEMVGTHVSYVRMLGW